MLVFLVAIVVIAISIIVFLCQPQFGSLPKGDRLVKIKESPNYDNGAFQNRSPTPDLTEGVSYWSVIVEFFWGDKSRVVPKSEIPSNKIDLHQLAKMEDVLVWFGHSSYFMQINGKRILVDPVLSGAATPLPFGTKAFPGSDVYIPEDIPAIDYLFITHDHWDHLDYQSITHLKERVACFVCGLGVGAHLEKWGIASSKIFELDWDQEVSLCSGFVVRAVSARHFSGRSLSRNQSLWVSFILTTPDQKVFIGGDSGYDKHFAEIGKEHGPFDMVILENGQYDKSWKYIHMMPDEVLTAAKDLKAKRLLPVHSSKFALANHSWDEPLELITHHNKQFNLNLATPMIGEKVYLKKFDQRFSCWWRGLE